MKVDYSERAQQALDQIDRDRITRVLSETLGQSAELVQANWDVPEDTKGRRLLTVELKDWTGSVTASLEPDEVKSDHHLRYRLYRLWGDLLRDRSNKLPGTANNGG
jgi:hypothetical protein